MGFLFGLMIGAAAMSGPGEAKPMLGSIPFRCLAALDQGDAAYRECRRPSLGVELREYIEHVDSHITGITNRNIRAKIEEALTLEVSGLRQIEAANKQRASGR